eukprot:CAMPEP_0114582532 /NCGR_PEP_ID=MMETSP0125-20121206/6491_1 /TAXON_ID=485358 ORGANISM="Aristerostoma sp., Strain ATCC 50986" /NCGR_SAMPLE_ID=MMETSP0125 /ASSEMBLY_ACC=CAM_ASM_000245 /LENGTH=164 /DNA_ID=CAMNT_0001775535 /DNA_START=111 /DNA_END=607 /DNA_ORIENTATION=-
MTTSAAKSLPNTENNQTGMVNPPCPLRIQTKHINPYHEARFHIEKPVPYEFFEENFADVLKGTENIKEIPLKEYFDQVAQNFDEKDQVLAKIYRVVVKIVSITIRDYKPEVQLTIGYVNEDGIANQCNITADPVKKTILDYTLKKNHVRENMSNYSSPSKSPSK